MTNKLTAPSDEIEMNKANCSHDWVELLVANADRFLCIRCGQIKTENATSKDGK